jgi:hypothetical protein
MMCERFILGETKEKFMTLFADGSDGVYMWREKINGVREVKSEKMFYNSLKGLASGVVVKCSEVSRKMYEKIDQEYGVKCLGGI